MILINSSLFERTVNRVIYWLCLKNIVLKRITKEKAPFNLNFSGTDYQIDEIEKY